jgi:hypothetical protein
LVAIAFIAPLLQYCHIVKITKLPIMSKFSKLVLLTVASITAFLAEGYTNPCDGANVTHLPFCDLSLPVYQRAADLVSRLTLAEKVSQVVNTAVGIPRLNIPAYQWWTGKPPSLPQPTWVFYLNNLFLLRVSSWREFWLWFTRLPH